MHEVLIRACDGVIEGDRVSDCHHEPQFTTISAIVMAPFCGAMWISRSSPCEKPFVEYRL